MGNQMAPLFHDFQEDTCKYHKMEDH